MKEITLSTKNKTAFIDITSQVAKAVTDMCVENGVITIFVPHTTAGITINENTDPDVVLDMQKTLDKLVPWNANYKHAEGNSAAHIKASLLGASVQIIVVDGCLQLGMWQGIYFCDFDGPRRRKIWITAD
ncbi:MAG: YjbQ family protein [Lentisphaerae bacterium]|nr:YjbQ family protein [Lentisphaerota bacterium]